MSRVDSILKLLVPGAIAIALAIVAAAAYADGLDRASGDELRQIVQGGLLYDKWYGVLKTDPPTTTHPAYSAQGKEKGASTWRCKECHGWDYRGRDGAYASGSHFSGIVGILGAQGKDPAAIVALLQDDTHRYGGRIPEQGLQALAMFVTRGLVDVSSRIVDKRAKGDAFAGGRLYQTICAGCHGADGRELDFGDANKPEYVGTLAQGNPWEALHKVRFGQPAEEMPAMVALTEQQQNDILAYAQTLPAK